jgi:hypothetical protein
LTSHHNASTILVLDWNAGDADLVMLSLPVALLLFATACASLASVAGAASETTCDINIMSNQTKKVITTTDTSAEQQYKYTYYRDNKFETFKVIIMLGVGTAMKSDDYSGLCTKLVTSTEKPILAVVVDFVPEWPIKNDPKRFVESCNSILKVLESKKLISFSEGITLVVGGHSGGGASAAGSLTVDGASFEHTPNGFFGLDPVPPGAGPFPGPFKPVIGIPSLNVGFAKKTCGVDPLRSARAAYSKSDTSHRTLLLISNDVSPNKYICHCAFSDHGCGVACPQAGDTETVKQGVADAFSIFLTTLDTGRNGDKEAYQKAIGSAPIVVKALDAEDVENKADLPWWKF